MTSLVPQQNRVGQQITGNTFEFLIKSKIVHIKATKSILRTFCFGSEKNSFQNVHIYFSKNLLFVHRKGFAFSVYIYTYIHTC